MRSTETGLQSTRDCERRSMAGPKRKASVVTQVSLATRQSLRELSRAAALGSEHKVSIESANLPMASAAWRYRGTITKLVRLVRTSSRETDLVSPESPEPFPPQAATVSRTVARPSIQRAEAHLTGLTATP